MSRLPHLSFPWSCWFLFAAFLFPWPLLVSFDVFTMINIIAWNCQGAASKTFLRAAKWIISSERPTIFALFETKISGDKATEVCGKLGFDHWIRVEAIGFSGGIWVMWNDTITLKVVASNPQFILANVTDDTNNEWSIAFVYASPTPHLRRKLRSALTPERLGGRKRWIAVGDFNSVTTAEEVSNPNTFALHRNANFNRWIFQEGFVDMGFQGARFTWMRGKGSESFKGARLDRALGSSDWLDTFPNTSVTHMPTLTSDHCPLKRSTERVEDRPRSRFFFQAAWPAHESFERVVLDNWKNTEKITTNAANMAWALTNWNRETFGNIHAKKRKLLARLGGIQKKLADNWHNGLVKLDRKLRAELEDVLNQEELLWYQQSRESWIRSGDRNTKYYHLATKVRRKQNKGCILADTAGRLAGSIEESGKFLQDYFSNIFAGQDAGGDSRVLGGGFPYLDTAYWTNLNCVITREEVKTEMFDMAPYKAPGPDGLPAGFYQKAWSIVGDSICSLVETYFETGTLPDGINDTLISLIPKVACPESVTQFGPISLCNVCYKVITKVMVNRMKPLLEKLVSREQSSFIPGRQIADNIVVYQEVLHSFRTSATKKKIHVHQGRPGKGI